MPNLLSTPSNWQDEAAGSPPSYWNGTAYEFLAGYVNHADTITATAAAGDTVGFTLQVNTAASHGTGFNFNVNGSSVFANDLTATGALTFTSAALSAGDIVELKFATLSGFEAYDLDATVTPTAAVVDTCTELGRVTRAYVSGYQRDRVHASRLVRGASRCLVANFNGAVDLARTVASVTWRCEQPNTIAMANARIPTGAREAAVDVTAQLQGCAWVKCIATLDNGEVYTQLFRLAIAAAPWFDGETAPSAGPTVLTSP